MAMQDVWRMKELGWDDPLPDTMCSLWKSIFGNLRQLDTVSYPRCLKPNEVTGQSELHVFGDASAQAYGAVAYMSWPTSEGPHVQLVSAKARVAPLQQTTVPRLELMAALVASRLATTIVQEFKEKPSRVILWSDSQIVLHWIRADSLNFKAFVGVRIGEIQSTWNADHWRYVPTSLNVADDLSRGISVCELGGRWLHGPSFLHGPESQWPENIVKNTVSSELLERKKPKIIGMCSSVANVIVSERFSSWKKLLRVTAYCFRFLLRLKQRVIRKTAQIRVTEDSLQCEEIEHAERYWVKTVQLSLLDWETQYLDLAPFMENGIIRVGGRLRHTTALQYDEKHPILLPRGNHVSKLIMEDVHVKVAHAGQERTLGECQRKFWILRGRNLARYVVRNCVVCRKLRQPAHTTVMADLPPERLRPFSPPFSVTGVDLFGPFLLKYGRNKTTKAWGALFTCANVRAIHLEIVDGLSTQAFLHALRRFVSHHGWPDTIISDNGTSFVGAQKELRSLVVEGRKDIENFAVLHKVKWKFITPLSPHQGGLYESLIKQTKRALSVAIGQQVLSWNEMSTAFAEAECLLNSRPLGYTSSDPNNLQPLTPNHFLLGRATADIPQGPYQETKNLHKRFEFVQMLVQQFWKRFIREYMPTLMRRAKWRIQGRQLQVGDVVLLVDYNSSRGKWDLARIVEVFPGHDGVVRNVKVKTKNGQYQRSIQKCCLILEHYNS
ncbi:uncharacterized protein LOC124265090 [Haliotis rubra]|uniref:uncharacterized protein LOC124265090 n=1 Tax=Haliotis rubra TaxID=36100 RepID=UPI001EE62A0F|nr:uncharacterized protein LOC124265090 [Haliotis rubra]